MAPDFDRQDLISIFVAEAEDSLAKLAAVLHQPQGVCPTREAIREQYIVAHTLKGASALYGYAEVAALTDILETTIEQSVECHENTWPMTVEMLRDLVRTLQLQIARIKETGSEDAGCSEAWAARHNGLFPACDVSAVSEQQASVDRYDLSDQYLLPGLDPEVVSYFAPEAQEYLETMESALLRLEKSPGDVEVLQQLFRTAHTLKGSAHTVGFTSIGDLIHHVEDFVGAVREGRMSMSSDIIDMIFRVIDVVKILMKRDSR